MADYHLMGNAHIHLVRNRVTMIKGAINTMNITESESHSSPLFTCPMIPHDQQAFVDELLQEILFPSSTEKFVKIETRSRCKPHQIVYLKQFIFTPNHVFIPGNYPVEELPDSAFEMGLVGVIIS
ncbi:MAG: hypothetical protein RLZZ338_456 [Cyanobacteriota bacterium]|jgi:hypothetical protein